MAPTMPRRPDGYRLILPQPWVRIPVQQGTRQRVEELVERRFADVPRELPPDQVGPLKRQLVDRLCRDVERSRDVGGIDVYLPGAQAHGILIGASFVVSQVSPPGASSAPEGANQFDILTDLVAEGAQAVEIDDSLWARSEWVEVPSDATPEMDVPTRKVTYTAAVPADEAAWMLVGFSGTGDGDPTSEGSDLVVELFDAIMSTWRWTYRDARGPGIHD